MQNQTNKSIESDAKQLAAFTSFNFSQLFVSPLVGRYAANIEHQVPLSSISVFRMASVSKQFTRFAVLLAEKGEINLDDDIRKYLTDLKDYDVIKSLPLEHQPDTQQDYSNFAYFLLSELVAKVSGMSMREYTTKYIFEPLGIRECTTT